MVGMSLSGFLCTNNISSVLYNIHVSNMLQQLQLRQLLLCWWSVL